MAEANSTAAMALIDDALQKLGRARLAVDLAGDLMERSRREIDTAGDAIASAAIELRKLMVKPLRQ